MRLIAFAIALAMGSGMVLGGRPVFASEASADSGLLWPKSAEEQVDKARKQLTGDVSDLASGDHLVRQLAYADITDRMRETIGKLLTLVEKTDADRAYEGTFHFAVRVLGALRATQAVTVLSDNLSYLPSTNMIIGGSGTYESYFPCALSLSKIGQPAIGSMVHVLEFSDDPLERRLANWVILTVEGSDQAIHRLTKMAEDTADRAVKARLDNAIAYLKSYKPDLTNPYIKKILKPAKQDQTSSPE